MKAKKRSRRKKYFTVAEANASLPLIRAIAQDITRLAHELQERHERLSRIRPPEQQGTAGAYEEELDQIQEEFERGMERMREYEEELRNLGVELKDHAVGLIDFPCRMDGHEVLLCWRLGEPEVSHWHELDAGFAGRKKLLADAAKGSLASRESNP
jgi:hypothetical protein